MGKIIRNGITYGGGSGSGSDGTVRYVNNESDANFDWIQVKDANGEWINVQRAYTQRYELYTNHTNHAEFTSHAVTSGASSLYVCHEASLTEVENGLQMELGNYAVNQFSVGCVISKTIDLTRFKTLKFDYHAWGGGNDSANSDTYIFLFISRSNKTGFEPLVRQDLFNYKNTGEQEKEVTVDISSLSGECYIGFEIHGYGKNIAYMTVDNMYME